MHRLTVSILDVSNALQNTNVLIHKIVCASPPTYFIDWSEIYYPNVRLNLYYGKFFIQFANIIQGTKP